jgi:hypothetical protein
MAEKNMLVSEKAKNLTAEIERHRAEAKKKGLSFTGLTEVEVYQKLTKKNSPMIVSQGWGPAPPGGTISYTVGIHNPDPVKKTCLFCQVLVGLANIASDVSDAVSAVDTRFARLTQPDFAGLDIEPGATKYLNFALPVPTNVERTNYMGNCFLFRATWHDPGEYLDRGLFVFKVT